MNKRCVIKEAIEFYIEQHKNTKDPDIHLTKLRMGKVLEEIETMTTPIEIKRIGGRWFSTLRTWIQNNFRNGSSVIWGSDDVLEGKRITVRDLEYISARVIAAAFNEYWNL